MVGVCRRWPESLYVIKNNHNDATLTIQNDFVFITELSPPCLSDWLKCESVVSCHACREYLPSSGPPTVSRAGSDPAAGCSEESEDSGPTDMCKLSIHAATARKAFSFRLIITSCPAAIGNHAKI